MHLERPRIEMEHGPFFFNESSLYTCGKQQSKTGTLVARVKNALETRWHLSQLWERVAWREQQQSRTDHTRQSDSLSSDSNVDGLSDHETGLPSEVYACNLRDLGLIPGLGKIPWRREWQPTPVFLPGEFHRWRSLAGYTPWEHWVGHDWATNDFIFNDYETSPIIFLCLSLYVKWVWCYFGPLQ